MMNMHDISMVILPLIILMNAAVGQNYKIRLKMKLKPTSKPSLSFFSLSTDKNAAYSEQLKNVLLSSHFKKYNGIFVPRSRSIFQKSDWVVRPNKHKQKSKELRRDMDEDYNEFEQKQDITKQRILKNSRNEVPKVSSFIENYQKYREWYFNHKYTNKKLEKKDGMDQARKLKEHFKFSEKSSDQNRFNRMLIGPIRQKGNEYKISKGRTGLNRKLTEYEKKIISKKIVRAISIVLVVFVIVSLVSLVATVLVHIFSKIFREKPTKQDEYEAPQRPKSIFFIDIDSSLRDESEKQKSGSVFYVDSEEVHKETVSPLEETPEDKDIEETSPLLLPKSISQNIEKDKYHFSTGTETVQMMVKITESDDKSPISSGIETKHNSASFSSSSSSQKDEETDLDTTAKFSKHQNTNNLYEDEVFYFLKSSGLSPKDEKRSPAVTKTNRDGNAIHEIKTRKIENFNNECKLEKHQINKVSLNDQVHDLYTVHTIKHTNLPSILQVKSESLMNSNYVTHSGDTYKKLSKDHGLNFKDFKINSVALSGSTGEEIEKSRVKFCVGLDKANDKLMDEDFVKKQMDSQNRNKNPVSKNNQTDRQLRRENTEITLDTIENSYSKRNFVSKEEKFIHY